MTSKALFKARYPLATVEKQRDGRRTYYLVRKNDNPGGRSFMWTGSGSTEGEAWTSACRAEGIAKPTKPKIVKGSKKRSPPDSGRCK